MVRGGIGREMEKRARGGRGGWVAIGIICSGATGAAVLGI